MGKSKPPLEYCALRFLIQWEQRERMLHEQISDNPTSQQIRLALGYFQVARTFKDLGKDDVAQEVADMLQDVDSNFGPSPVEKVITLASRFKKRFKRSNVSAASKLFWLKHKSPYIIYDSRAVNALRYLDSTFSNANYKNYCICWQEQYRQRKEKINEATSRLHKVREFLPPWHESGTELTALVSQPWFFERVFDIFLWEIGGEG